MPITPESIGTIVSVSGHAYLDTESGLVPLEKGDSVTKGAVIVTQEDGRVEVRFEDDTVLSQAENSRIVVDDYIYDREDGSNSLFMLNMVKGVMRTVTGKIAEQNPDEFKVQSPLATIGIRGTEFWVITGEDGDKVYLGDIEPGHIMVVQDQFGTIRFMNTTGTFATLVRDTPMGPLRLAEPEELQRLESLTPINAIPAGNDTANEGEEGTEDAQAAEDAENPEDLDTPGTDETDEDDPGQPAGRDGEAPRDGGDEDFLETAQENVDQALEQPAAPPQPGGEDQQAQNEPQPENVQPPAALQEVTIQTFELPDSPGPVVLNLRTPDTAATLPPPPPEDPIDDEITDTTLTPPPPEDTIDEEATPPQAESASITIKEDTFHTGWLQGTDAEGDALAFSLSQGPGHGSAQVNANGAYVYTPTADYFGTDSFTFRVVDENGDSDTGTINVVVTAENDAPVGSDDTAQASEAGGADNGTSGVNAGGNVLSNDIDVDDSNTPAGSITVISARQGTEGTNTAVSPETTSTDGLEVDGLYGTLTIGSDGSFIYMVDNANPVVDSLDTGESVTDIFRYTLTDGTGLTDTATLTITVNGADDAPVLGGTTTGTVSEDGTLATSGTLTISDADTSDNPVSFNDQAATDGDNGYGSFVLSGGAWAYTLNNAHADVQALDSGETLSDAITYTATDGSQQTVTMTINGAEDAPVLGGIPLGSVTEDGTLTASGTLTITDVDTSDNPVSFPDRETSTSNNGYGSFTLSGGSWTYTLDNDHIAVQALDAGERLTDTITYTATDTSIRTIIVTINGAEDAPTLDAVPDGAIIENAQAGSTTDSDLSGTLSAADVDGDVLTFGIEGGMDAGTVMTAFGTYGNMTLNTSTGEYFFAKDIDAIEALGAGETDTDSFTFTVSDGGNGTVNQTYDITITGANDAPIMQPEMLEFSMSAKDQDTDGVTVASFLSDSVSDMDAGSAEGLALYAVSMTLGSFDYSVDGGTTWQSVPDVSQAQSLLLRSEDMLRYMPDGSTGEAVSFGYVAWDQSNGEDLQGTLQSTELRGDDTAYSTQQNSIVINADETTDELSFIMAPGQPLYGSLIPEGDAPGDAFYSGINSYDTMVTPDGTFSQYMGYGQSFDFIVTDIETLQSYVATAQVKTIETPVSLSGVYEPTSSNDGPLYLQGGATADTITGTSFGDIIDGGGETDTLNGGGGNDTFLLSSGNDTIDGGTGEDTVDYSSSIDYEGSATTIVLGDTPGTGTAQAFFNDGTSPALVRNTLDNIENIIGSTSGTDNITGNSASNIFFGNYGDDFLNGMGGDDILHGGEGNDTLTGGAGNDIFYGGYGADILHGDENGSVETYGDIFLYESLYEGGDTIFAFDHATDSILFSAKAFSGYTGESDISPGELTPDHFVTLAGTDADNYLSATPTVIAYDTFVYLQGTTNNPTPQLIFNDYDEGTGVSMRYAVASLPDTPYLDHTDIIILPDAPPAARDQLLVIPENYTYHGNLQIINQDDITALTLTDGPDHGIVEIALDGTYTYTPDVDYQGQDSFTFLAIDEAGYSTQASVTFDILFPVDSSGNALGPDAFTLEGTDSAEALTGTVGDDVILAMGGDDTVDGSLGNDRIIGGPGSDTFNGNAGSDTVDYTHAENGITLDLSHTTSMSEYHTTAATYGGTSFTDNLDDIENVIGTAYSDSITGNDAPNLLVGNGGDDSFDAQDGDDLLIGGGGDDYLNGSYGSDLFIAGPGSDQFVGFDDPYAYATDSSYEPDTVDYGQSEAGIEVNLTEATGTWATVAPWTASGTFEGTSYTDSLNSIENIVGSNFADSIEGGYENNTFWGLAGDDRMAGNGGRDILIGGSGNDLLHGGTEDDSLRGGEGSDILYGGSGSDDLSGGTGSDEYRYLFSEEFGDFIHDFESGVDKLTFDGANCFASSPLSSISGSPTAFNEYLFYDPGTGTEDAKLCYDQDGTGTGEAVVIAEFDAGTQVLIDDIQIA